MDHIDITMFPHDLPLLHMSDEVGGWSYVNVPRKAAVKVGAVREVSRPSNFCHAVERDLDLSVLPKVIDAKLKVVIAEDHDLQRRYICHLVSQLGHEAVPVVDGLEALAKVRAIKAEVLISDLNMPNMDGLELTREIRKLDLGHYVHVFVLTGNEDDATREKALYAGADDFMSKKPGQATLMARIRSAERLIKHERELAEKNRALFAANELIENDVRAAARAQRSLLPKGEFALQGVDISSLFVPSSIVSGDMIGLHDLGSDCIGLYMVDVSGHGVEASLLSVAIGHLITPEYFREIAVREDGSHDPAALVDALNKRFCHVLQDRYFTMFCAMINVVTGEVTFTQAGSPSPYLISPDGEASLIGAGGFPVAMFPEAEYVNETAWFDMGASFVICSDAAIEAEDTELQPFGADRLKAVLAIAQPSGPNIFPKAVADALRDWRDGRNLDDDFTVIALKRTKKE